MRHIIALSGGKDSTAMALRLRELNPGTRYTYVLTPTGDELPDMEDHWKNLESRLGHLTRLGTQSIFQLIDRKKMIPNFRARFCTEELKVKLFINYMSSLSLDSVMYVGLRADEPGRLGIIDTEININYPLRDWEWGINDVLTYLNFKNVTIPARTDCGCCPLQRLPEWRELLKRYPDRYEKYVQIEKKYKHTFRSPNRDTWPAGLDELRKEIRSGRKMRVIKTRGTKKCRFCTL